MRSSGPGILRRFSVFELDDESGELRKHGLTLHVPRQSILVLSALLDRQGQVDTREELRSLLWPDQKFGELDHRLNKVANKLREALSDCADTPRFVETIPRTGYRFLQQAQVIKREAADKFDAISTPPPKVPETIASPRGVGSHERWLWLGYATVSALLVTVGASFAFHGFRSPDGAYALQRSALTGALGFEMQPAFSPNGKHIAYSWNTHRQDNFDIYIASLEDGTVRRLSNSPKLEATPAWSPDGNRIAYLRYSSPSAAQIIVQHLTAGSETALGSIAASFTAPSMTWSSDSRWIIIPDLGPDYQSALYAVCAATGDRRRLTSPPVESRGDFNPAVSWDGRRLAFTRSVSRQWKDIFLIDLTERLEPASKPVRLTAWRSVVAGLAWEPGDSHLLVTHGGWGGPSFLTRVSTSGRTHTSARAAALAEGRYVAVSRDGRIAVSHSTLAESRISRLILRRSGTSQIEAPTHVITSSGGDSAPDLSPDGKMLAFSSRRTGSHEIWIAGADGSNLQGLTSFGEDGATSPRWSPDGRNIAFDSRRNGQSDIYLIEIRSRHVRQITFGSSDEFSPGWSRDGRKLYFCSTRSGTPQIWRKQLDTGTEQQITRGGGFIGRETADGRRLTYMQTYAPSRLRTVPTEGGAEVDLNEVSGVSAGFAEGKDGLYVLSAEAGGNVALRFRAAGTSRTVVIAKFPARLADGLTLSADGRSIYYAEYGHQLSNIFLLAPFAVR